MAKNPDHNWTKSRRYWQRIWLLVVALLGLCLLFALILSSKVQGDTPTDPSDWVRNPEVDLVGRGAIKAIDFVDWSLGLREDIVGNVSDTIRNSLYSFWKVSIGVTILLFLIFIVIYSYGLMVRATWLEKWRRYIPWFVGAIILSGISFFAAILIISLFGELMSAIMKNIGTASNLIGINIDYKNFVGMSDPDPSAIESIQNTLLLVRIVIVTLYAIGIVFTIRMFVLWFMTILAPLIFPLLIFPRTRGFATVWMKEFTRWLVLGPLFAFLLLIASYWSNVSELSSTATTAEDTYYTSTTTIELAPASSDSAPAVTEGTGGTGLSSFTSYSLFIVGILLLWMAIIMPWLLLGYAMPAVGEGAKKWFNNRDSVLTNELRKFFSETARPASAQAVGTVLMSNLVNQKAGEKIKTISGQPIASSPSTRLSSSNTQTASKAISLTSALKVNGFNQLSEIVDKRVKQLTTSRSSRLVDIAKFETNPQAIQALTQEVDVLGGRVQSDDIDQKIDLKTLRNKINLTNEPEAMTHKDLVAAINMNNSQLVQPSVATSMRSNVYRQTKNEFNKIIHNPQIAHNQSLTSTLNEINQLINQHEAIPPTKIEQKNSIRLKIGDLAEKVEVQLKQNPIQLNNQTAIDHSQSSVVNNVNQTSTSQSTINNSVNNTDKSLLPATASTSDNQAHDDNQSRAGGTTLPESLDSNSLERQMSILKTTSRLDNNDSKIEDILITSNEPTQLNESQPEICITDDSRDDYKSTMAFWQKYFRQTEFPRTSSSRAQWLEGQLISTEAILKQLMSLEMIEREKALEQIKYLMPYLILGNYSLSDIILYLKAKSAAIKLVLNENETGP